MHTENLVGASNRIRRIIGQCEAVASSRSKVLLTGESGVGKEVFAHYIHNLSPRRDSPMITINCAGVPESLLESELFGHVRGSFTDAHRDRRGLLEAANHGTILLDEIGEMGMRMQTMLLRFLESGEIQRVGADQPGKPLDVRLIAATNRDLWGETQKKAFRSDLYYRLNVVHLVVPPLRERQEDIKPLLYHFLKLASALEKRVVPELTADAIACLETYAWPGNVRELKNLAERLVVGCRQAITVEDLPLEIRSGDAAASATAPADPWQRLIADRYERMTIGGESFWTAVYEPFIHRDLTRDALRGLVRRGLEETRGSYPRLVSLFNIPDEDYRKFMRFLHKHDCHMPIQAFRMLRSCPPVAAAPAAAGLESPARAMAAEADFALGEAV